MEGGSQMPDLSLGPLAKIRRSLAKEVERHMAKVIPKRMPERNSGKDEKGRKISHEVALRCFGSGGGYKGGFCETLTEASPKSNGANASGSKMDTPLAKAEPISDSGSASRIPQLRDEKKITAQEQLGPENRGVRTCGTNSFTDTKSTEDNKGAEIHLQPVGETHAGASESLKEAPREAHTRAVNLRREKSALEQVCWQDWKLCGGLMLEQPVLEGLTPV
ncbi:hypothetical protein DUI87_23050 [Hirundo rustica rustica]|uniref:Uncharacterized protein n=1 Tax=Hirundo rustica rustica TaxID=333673 RepID=A0A3M0JJD9_HIRRU|nr:hypothetical protein DUI87_23050 [Hirundo rustica rustica]